MFFMFGYILKIGNKIHDSYICCTSSYKSLYPGLGIAPPMSSRFCSLPLLALQKRKLQLMIKIKNERTVGISKLKRYRNKFGIVMVS